MRAQIRRFTAAFILLALCALGLWGQAKNSAELQYISWQPQAGASSYYVEIRQTTDDKKIVFSATTQETSLWIRLAPGSYEFQVTTYNKFGKPAGTTGWKPLTIVKTYLPRIDSFSSEPLIAGSSQLVAISGENFMPESQVFLQRGEVTITGIAQKGVTSTSIKVIFDLTGAQAGMYHLAIVNPGNLRAEASGLAEIIQRSQPKIVQISKTAFINDRVYQGIAIIGEGFERGLTARLENSERRIVLNVRYESAVAASFDLAAGLAIGIYDLVVTNPGNLSDTQVAAVTIAAPGKPVIRNFSRSVLFVSELRTSITIVGAEFRDNMTAWLELGATRIMLERTGAYSEDLYNGFVELKNARQGLYDLVLSNGPGLETRERGAIEIKTYTPVEIGVVSPDTILLTDKAEAIEFNLTGNGFFEGMKVELQGPGELIPLTVAVKSQNLTICKTEPGAIKLEGFYDLRIIVAGVAPIVFKHAVFAKKPAPVQIVAASPTPSPTPSAVATASPSPSATPSPVEPSAQPSPSATATPEPPEFKLISISPSQIEFDAKGDAPSLYITLTGTVFSRGMKATLIGQKGVYEAIVDFINDTTALIAIPSGADSWETGLYDIAIKSADGKESLLQRALMVKNPSKDTAAAGTQLGAGGEPEAFDSRFAFGPMMGLPMGSLSEQGFLPPFPSFSMSIETDLLPWLYIGSSYMYCEIFNPPAMVSSGAGPLNVWVFEGDFLLGFRLPIGESIGLSLRAQFGLSPIRVYESGNVMYMVFPSAGLGLCFDFNRNSAVGSRLLFQFYALAEPGSDKVIAVFFLSFQLALDW